jgi:hypothetical protein
MDLDFAMESLVSHCRRLWDMHIDIYQNTLDSSAECVWYVAQVFFQSHPSIPSGLVPKSLDHESCTILDLAAWHLNEHLDISA